MRADRNRQLEQLLTVEDAMDILQVSRKTILRLVRSGKIPSIRFGNRLRLRPDALRAWLERAEGG